MSSRLNNNFQTVQSKVLFYVRERDVVKYVFRLFVFLFCNHSSLSYAPVKMEIISKRLFSVIHDQNCNPLNCDAFSICISCAGIPVVGATVNHGIGWEECYPLLEDVSSDQGIRDNWSKLLIFRIELSATCFHTTCFIESRFYHSSRSTF